MDLFGRFYLKEIVCTLSKGHFDCGLQRLDFQLYSYETSDATTYWWFSILKEHFHRHVSKKWRGRKYVTVT